MSHNQHAHDWTRQPIGYYVFEGVQYALQSALGRPTAAGNTLAIAAPPANERVFVVGYRLQGSGTVNVKFTDTDGADLSQLWEFQAREGCKIDGSPPMFEFAPAAGKGVNVNLSAAVPVNVTLHYIQVKVGA